MKIFLLKVKYFVKRNIYPITVSLCTALMIGIIAISAYTSIKAANKDSVIVGTQTPAKEEDEKPKQDDDKQQEDEKPKDDDNSTETGSNETIIFDLPFDGATISKEYAEDKLLYDATTKFWCTHQGLDFACTENQKVVAIFGGKITKIESSMMNGTVVYLKVSDNLTVVYKGLSSSISVKEGDTVTKGQEIGSVTSMLSEKADGIHLHLELLKDDKLIDPTEYFSFNK